MKKTFLQDQIKKYYIALSAAMLFIVSTVIALFGARLYWVDISEMCISDVELNHDIVISRLTEIRNNQEILAKSSSTRELAAYYNETGGADPIINLTYQHQIRGAFYLLSRNFSINSVYLVNTDGKIFYSCREMPREDSSLQDEEWFTEVITRMHRDECRISVMHDRPYMITNSANQVVSLIRPVLAEYSVRYEPLAYIIFDIDIRQFLRKNEKETIQYLMIDKKGNIEFAPDFDVSEYTMKALASVGDMKDTSKMVYGGLKVPDSMIVRATLDAFDITLVGVRGFPGVRRMLVFYFFIIIGVLTVALIIVSLLAERISGNILRPMERLVNECNEIAAGNELKEFSEKESEEISFLSDTIENMVRNLSDLTKKVAEEEIRLSEEKVRVLQHQINPHFINNTLQAMKALSLEGETEKVSRIATLLGRFLTYSVYEPYQSVTLETETAYVKNYIELQNIRHDGRILFNSELEEGTKNVLLPKMTLQPLIENCINHGLDKEGALTINISSEMDSRGISISIYDNGSGIPAGILEKLKEDLQTNSASTKTSSIGVLNVNERLFRMFGPEYSMDVRSHVGTGTTIILNLPKGSARSDQREEALS